MIDKQAEAIWLGRPGVAIGDHRPPYTGRRWAGVYWVEDGVLELQEMEGDGRQGEHHVYQNHWYAGVIDLSDALAEANRIVGYSMKGR